MSAATMIEQIDQFEQKFRDFVTRTEERLASAKRAVADLGECITKIDKENEIPHRTNVGSTMAHPNPVDPRRGSNQITGDDVDAIITEYIAEAGGTRPVPSIEIERLIRAKHGTLINKLTRNIKSYIQFRLRRMIAGGDLYVVTEKSGNSPAVYSLNASSPSGSNTYGGRSETRERSRKRGRGRPRKTTPSVAGSTSTNGRYQEATSSISVMAVGNRTVTGLTMKEMILRELRTQNASAARPVSYQELLTALSSQYRGSGVLSNILSQTLSVMASTGTIKRRPGRGYWA